MAVTRRRQPDTDNTSEPPEYDTDTSKTKRIRTRRKLSAVFFVLSAAVVLVSRLDCYRKIEYLLT